MDIDRETAIEILQRLQFDLSKVNLTKDTFMVPCIEHQDRKPSCSINLAKGLYHCFSCDKKGALTSLYYEHCGHSIFRDLGISTRSRDQFTSGIDDIRYEKPNYDEVPSNKIKFEGLAVKAWDSPACRKFLEGRGFSKKVSEQMSLWYAIDGKVVDENNPDPLENFIEYKNRLMIPIREGKNNLSIEGRDIFGKDAHKGSPDSYRKCLYPKGASTSTLFQYDRLDKSKELHIMESLMSLGAMRVSPKFQNSTSVFGASIATRQVWLLLKFPKIIFHIDNDFAGWKSLYALGQAMERLEKGSSSRLFYVLPPRGAKDVGDIFEKLHMTIDECDKKHGFDRVVAYDAAYLKPIVDRMAAEEKAKKARELLAKDAKKDIDKEKANEQSAH
jgi:DNA primase